MYRIFLNFAKIVPFLKYKRLKLKLRVFSAGYSVAMVTCCVTKMILPRTPVIGQFFDTKRGVILNNQNLRLG